VSSFRKSPKLYRDFENLTVPPKTGWLAALDTVRVYVNIHTRLGIEHESVNHSVNFVNPINTAIKTNMIESSWAAVKQKVKSHKNANFFESCIARYLYESEHPNKIH
jgi:hypothetical protein